MIDIDSLPTRNLRVGVALERIFRTYRDGSPASGWFYSSVDLARPGRFDLVGPHGTCYFADDIAGSWLETFRNTTTVSLDDVASRSVATVRRTRPGVRLIDVTDPRARGTGVTLDLSSGSEHAVSRAFAAQVHQRGHDGIVSWIRHDPAAEFRSHALFGNAGPGTTPRGWSMGVASLQRRAAEVVSRLGVRVLAVPHDLPISRPPDRPR